MNLQSPLQNTSRLETDPIKASLASTASKEAGNIVGKEPTDELKDLMQAGDQKAKAETKQETEGPNKDGFFFKLNQVANKYLGQSWINNSLIVGDALSAATDIFKWVPSLEKKVSKSVKDMLPWKKIKHFVDTWSVRLTKGAIMLRYMNAGLGALLNNRGIEAFGRIAGVLPMPFVKLEDLTLATGLATFFSQTDLGLEQKIGANKKAYYPSFLENTKEWFSNWLKLGSEIIEKGFAGADRNLFPDFKLSDITEIPKRFIEDFITQPGKDGKPGEKERGHTAVFGAYFIGFGALIGVLFGRKSRNIWNKLGGAIRNFGGILGDYSLLTHTDSNMRQAGYFFGAATVIDAVQRFLPKWMINTINHLNCINNLVASKFYSDRTKNRNNGDITVSGDADRKKQKAMEVLV